MPAMVHQIYGNKFGEPLIAGYTRTFGLRMPSGERREWIKPIMFRCGSAADPFCDQHLMSEHRHVFCVVLLLHTCQQQLLGKFQ